MKTILFMLLVALDGIAQEGLLITRISSSPVFKGDLIHFIQTNIRYPSSAVLDSVQGRVNVEFIIDTIGYTFNHRILKGGIREDLNQEALRVTRLDKNLILLAFQKDKPVVIKYVVSRIDFKLKYKTEDECR